MSRKIDEDFNEIVFKDRNKEYGAYYLRKVDKKYTTRSLMISLGVLLLGVLIPFFIYKQARSVNVEKSVAAEFTTLNKAPEEAPPPPPPPPEEQAVEQKAKFTAPVVTTDSVDQGEVFNQDDLNTQTTNFAPDTATKIVINEKKEEVIEVEKTYSLIEISEYPSFPGGDAELFKFLKENIKYPEFAKDNNIQGTVYVEFTVNKDGSITDIRKKEGTRDVGAGCDEEAFRVVRLMPKWVSGKFNGNNVKVSMLIPVRFKLEN